MRFDTDDRWASLRDQIIGLGEGSLRKSYYPELQRRLADLERFRTLLDYALDAILLARLPGGRVVDLNAVACRLLGKPRRALLGADLGECLALPGLTRQLRSGRRNKSERRLVHTTLRGLDGKERSLEIQVGTVAMNEGEYAVVVARDVTEQRLAEEELRTAYRQLADILEFLPDPTCVVDREKRVVAWNRALEEITGVSRKDMIGQGDYAYAVPFYGRRQPTLIDLVMLEQWRIPPEYQSAREKNGSLSAEVFVPALHGGAGAHLWVKASRLYDADGEIVGAVETVRDISERKRVEAQLKAAYAELEQVFRAAADGMWVIGADFTVLRCNQRLAQLLQLEVNEVVGRKCYDLLGGDNCGQPSCPLHRLSQGAETVEREVEVARADGAPLHLLASAAPLIDSAGSFLGMVESLKDITERKKWEEELRTYHLIMEHARDAILFLGMDGRILDVNGAAVGLYGYERDELLGMNIADLRLPGTAQGHQQQMEEAYERGLLLETTHRRKDGSRFPVEVSAHGLRVNGERALVSVIRDITERKRAEREIRHLSFSDKLTGLHNRAHFEERLRELSDADLPCSIILGDLNGLKVVNDAFGHAEGDRLLMEAARLLKSVCRSEDVVARWGGDEFLVLLPRTDEQTALKVVERIRQAFAHSHIRPVRPSIALGVATKALPDQDIHQVLQLAESHMYRRKLLESNSARSFSIQSLQRSLQEKSIETEEHATRLRALIARLAEAMQLPASTVDELDLLASLHDVGKIAIPDDILKKPGPLTADEWEIMKRHPEIGYRIARTSPDLATIAEDILAHHERWDGSGYPKRLAGQRIPLAARILAVADAFDAMTSDRPYRAALPVEEALDELRRNAGTQFDPDVVHAFLACWNEMAM